MYKVTSIFAGGVVVLLAAQSFGQTSSPRSGEPNTRPDSQNLHQSAEEPEGPVTIRYKGLSLTPGGFLEGTFLVRTRNENADFPNTYTGVPLNGSTNSKLTEYRGS